MARFWAVILSLVLASPAHALVVGSSNVLTITNGVSIPFSNLIVLGCAYDSTHLSTFRKPNTGSGYTPSGSNKFQLVAVEVSGGFATNIKVAYGNSDIGWLAVSEPAGVIHEYTNSSTAAYPYRYTPATLNTSVYYNTQFQIPNGKYPFCNFDSGTGTGVVRIYGYETP